MFLFYVLPSLPQSGLKTPDRKASLFSPLCISVVWICLESISIFPPPVSCLWFNPLSLSISFFELLPRIYSGLILPHRLLGPFWLPSSITFTNGMVLSIRSFFCNFHWSSKETEAVSSHSWFILIPSVAYSCISNVKLAQRGLKWSIVALDQFKYFLTREN